MKFFRWLRDMSDALFVVAAPTFYETQLRAEMLEEIERLNWGYSASQEALGELAVEHRKQGEELEQLRETAAGLRERLCTPIGTVTMVGEFPLQLEVLDVHERDGALNVRVGGAPGKNGPYEEPTGPLGGDTTPPFGSRKEIRDTKGGSMITDEQIRNAINLRNRVAVAVAATNMFGRDEPASYTVDAITASLLQVEAMEPIRAK